MKKQTSEKIPANKPHRVVNCRRDLRPILIDNIAGKNVYEMSKPSVYKHKETGHTFLGGTMICGSSYACPVCAPKIAEERAAEIRKGVSEHVKNGGICIFTTLTFPHQASDKIKASMDALKAALTLFRESNFKRLMKPMGYSGLIRSIETTWGEANGWHPHSHEIWFLEPEFLRDIYSMLGGKSLSVSNLTYLFQSFLKPDLFPLWVSACKRAGLDEPNYERGMDIKVCETEDQLQERLSDYLTKTGLEKPPWGVDDELTKLHSKKGKTGRLTPFDFLREQFNPELTKEQKYRYRCLFAEFVIARKGVISPYWSPGLKKRFQIKELTDEQIAEEKTEAADLVLEIPPPIWVFVIGINDHRAQLLTKVKNEGVEAAKAWLSDLLSSYAEYFEEKEKYELLSPNLRQILEYHGVGLND